MRNFIAPFSAMRHLDFWSIAAFNGEGAGDAGGGGRDEAEGLGGGNSYSYGSGSGGAPSTSTRPQARPSASVMAGKVAAAEKAKAKAAQASAGDDRRAAATKAAATKAAATKAAATKAAATVQAEAAATEENNRRNSLYQSIANRITPNDGQEYSGGVLGPNQKATGSATGGTNSFYENTANLFTPNNDTEYVDGLLVDKEKKDSLSSRGYGNAPGILGVGQKALNFLGGIRPEDEEVGNVNGRAIYARSDGTTYSRNALGLAYDTAGNDSIDESPESLARRESLSGQPQFGADDPIGPMSTENVFSEESPGAVADPCPDGYVMDPETSTCVIDAFSTPFMDDFTGTGPAQPPTTTANLSPYTAAAPMAGLPALNPGPQSNFVVPTSTPQPISIAQQGLGSLPARIG